MSPNRTNPPGSQSQGGTRRRRVRWQNARRQREFPFREPSRPFEAAALYFPERRRGWRQ
jgi:hypothetical protein